MKDSKVITIITILVIITFSYFVLGQDCENHDKCRADLEWGENSECDNGTCRCKDYFTAGRNDCVTYVPHGRPCVESAQCQAALGPMSQCNKTDLVMVCECYSLIGHPITLINGKCERMVLLGAACASHAECYAGTLDEFSRCIDNVCKCYSNGTIHLTPGEDGKCTLAHSDITTTPHSHEQDTVSLSVFAVCVSISVVLLLLVVFIYWITNPNKNSSSINRETSENISSSASAIIIEQKTTTEVANTSADSQGINNDSLHM